MLRVLLAGEPTIMKEDVIDCLDHEFVMWAGYPLQQSAVTNDCIPKRLQGLISAHYVTMQL